MLGMVLNVCSLSDTDREGKYSVASFSPFAHDAVRVMDYLPIGMIVALDSDGEVLVGNNAVYDLFGLPQSSGLADMPQFQSVNTGHVLAPGEFRLRKAMRYDCELPAADYLFTARTGARRCVAISAKPLHGTDGEVVGGVALLIDLTQSRAQGRASLEEWDRLRELAGAFQIAQRPQGLPTVPGYALHALHASVDATNEVGGDWYDVFALADGRIAISVGDVMGHGIKAAVTMGKLRQSMQSAAFVRADPLVMLDAAESALLNCSNEQTATALAGILDPQEATFWFASAGHPMPLILSAPTLCVREFAGAGPPLGSGFQAKRDIRFTQFRHGDLALMFTDGLLESSGDIILGEKQLRSALAAGGFDYADPARTIRERVLGNDLARDDLTILTVCRLL
jgi:hypothetical protein